MKAYRQIFKRLTGRITRWFLEFPGRLSIIGFILLIAAGTGLLMLPQASAGPESIGFVDALFTSTSASCVTGLAVMDTGTAFSRFGQIIILGLIQVGGLGIMTVSTLFILIAGRRVSMMERLVIQDTFTHQNAMGPALIIREVILFALAIEGIGSLLLFIGFLPGRTPGEAIWFSMFHAVSAFCNAGFALFPDSLTRYQTHWLVNLTVCLLIVAGGIGFLVLSEIRRHFPFRGKVWSRLSLHSKLVFSATAILITSSTLLFLFMEWRNTLADLPLGGKFLAAFFQAVTTRTAGFNTLPLENMSNETLFLFIILMFIGAGPGSCAGGVKITTITTLTILGLSRFRGHEHPRIFCRTIPDASVWKAINVVMTSGFVVVVSLMLLQITELGSASHMITRGKFLELFFEVVSAFGTVGLSTGVTGELSVTGRLIITVVMFMGRLGPLVIGIAISRQRNTRFYYAEEDIMVG